jgi:hypothetical protein
LRRQQRVGIRRVETRQARASVKDQAYAAPRPITAVDAIQFVARVTRVVVVIIVVVLFILCSVAVAAVSVDVGAGAHPAVDRQHANRRRLAD